MIGAVLLVGAAAPASVAETHTDKDPRGDVIRGFFGEDSHPTNAANGDIVHTRLTYTEERFVAVIRFRELTKKAKLMWIGIGLHFRQGPDHVYGEIEVVLRHKGPRQPRARYSEVSGDASCSVESHISYVHDRIRFAMPASCLADTPWVHAFAAAMRTDNLDDPSYFISDRSPDSARGGYGPRVDRG